MLSTFTYLYLCKQSAIAGALAFCSPWLSVSLSSWLLASFNAYVGKNHESLPKSEAGLTVELGTLHGEMDSLLQELRGADVWC
jgi:hypothetical protein